jgi:hypothetical protein
VAVPWLYKYRVTQKSKTKAILFPLHLAGATQRHQAAAGKSTVGSTWFAVDIVSRTLVLGCASSNDLLEQITGFKVLVY